MKILETKYALKLGHDLYGPFGRAATVDETGNATQPAYGGLFYTIREALDHLRQARVGADLMPVAVDKVSQPGSRRFQACDRGELWVYDINASTIPVTELPCESVIRWVVRELR